MKNSRRRLLFGLLLLIAVARANAQTVFTNEAAFTSALAGSLTRTNELNDLEPGNFLHPFNWSDSGLSCSIVSDPLLLLYALTNALSTDTPTAGMVLRFPGTSVRAAGAQMFLTDLAGTPVAGMAELCVAGGPTIPLVTTAGARPFVGLISSGPLLTNLTLVSLVTNAYPTLDHLVLAEGQPALQITRPGTDSLTLQWPAPSTGYVLEQRAPLTGSPWLAVTGTPVRTNNNWQLSLPTPGAGALLRLRRP